MIIWLPGKTIVSITSDKRKADPYLFSFRSAQIVSASAMMVRGGGTKRSKIGAVSVVYWHTQ